MRRSKPDPNPSREMPFTAHLEELRMHILRSLLYICLFCCASWYYYDPLYDLIATPLIRAFSNAGFSTHMVFLDIMEPLLFKVQVVLSAAVVFALPFILWEIWRFVAPGLYKNEQVFVKPLLPFSIVLCFAGFALIYYALPIAFEFLLKFAPKPGDDSAELMQHLQRYFFFLLRMMISAGVVFQTPLLMLLLAQLELVTAAGLLRFWRHAVLVCFIVAAVITPTIDPFNMSIIAIPLVGLFFLSVILVWFVDQKRARTQAASGETPPETGPDESGPPDLSPPPIPPVAALPAPAPGTNGTTPAADEPPAPAAEEPPAPAAEATVEVAAEAAAEETADEEAPPAEDPTLATGPELLAGIDPDNPARTGPGPEETPAPAALSEPEPAEELPPPVDEALFDPGEE